MNDGDRILGRPRGELRQVLCEAAAPLAAERGCFDVRTAAAYVRTTVDDARHTLRNMTRAGELTVVGSARLPGANRPANLYAPASARSPHDDPAVALQMAMRTWRDFV